MSRTQLLKCKAEKIQNIRNRPRDEDLADDITSFPVSDSTSARIQISNNKQHNLKQNTQYH